MNWATYLVRLGNAEGIYSTILGAEDGEKAVNWARYQAGANAKKLAAEAQHGRTLTAQETAFIAWCEMECEPVKVLALMQWDGRLGDELPIFAPTGQAAWSLALNKTVAGRVSRLEVAPKSLAIECYVCGATYSGAAADYWELPDNYIFRCGCEEPNPVCDLIAPNGDELDAVAQLATIRQWERENAL